MQSVFTVLLFELGGTFIKTDGEKKTSVKKYDCLEKRLFAGLSVLNPFIGYHCFLRNRIRNAFVKLYTGCKMKIGPQTFTFIHSIHHVRKFSMCLVVIAVQMRVSSVPSFFNLKKIAVLTLFWW